MRHNKLFIMALAAAIATPAVVAPITIEAATTSFKDISSSYPNKAKIDALVQKGVITGFTDGTFRPTEKVNRGQFALFISRALDLPMPSNPQPFKDVGKTSAVYEGVVKAQAAGIIKGYEDGRFRAGDLISRGDMAIMLDRALQYNGSFTQKSTLYYTDKGSIGSSALEAVQRLTYYKIMGVISGTSFSATTKGDRISTVLSIFRLMEMKNLLSDGPTDFYPTGDLRNYSYEELVQEVGEWKVLRRGGGDGTMYEIDAVQEMYEKLRLSFRDDDVPLRLTPKEFFKGFYLDIFNNAYGGYWSSYPYFEYAAINGVPFRDTEFFKNSEAFNNPLFVKEEILLNQIPKAPKESGQFLIDLPSANKDLVTYTNGSVEVERMATLVKRTSNNDYLVDIKSVFKDNTFVTVSNDGLTITTNGKTLTLQASSNKATLNGQTVTLKDSVKNENGVILVPFKTVTNQLGLYWRQMDNAKRFEIANYPLETDILGWEEWN